MLQQTQVDRVRPKFLAWKKRWPTTRSLAQADLHSVLQLWSGLGYNSRGKRLRDAARVVVEKYSGRWPRQIDLLESLPGFGPYTARAVASFSYNTDTAVIDTNVRRVVSRIFFGVRLPNKHDLQDVVEKFLPRGKSADWNAALMDFGSAVCTSRAPKCGSCPLQSVCRAYPAILDDVPDRKKAVIPFIDTDRYLRGAIVRAVLRYRQAHVTKILRDVQKNKVVDKERVVRLLADMVKDGVLQRARATYKIAA